MDNLLNIESLESVTLTRKQLKEFRERVVAETLADRASERLPFRERFKDAYEALNVAAFASPFWNQQMEEVLTALEAEIETRAARHAAMGTERRINSKERPPEPGLIVKGWKNGNVWAGYCDGSAKMSACDWWMPIPEGE